MLCNEKISAILLRAVKGGNREIFNKSRETIIFINKYMVTSIVFYDLVKKNKVLRGNCKSRYRDL